MDWLYRIFYTVISLSIIMVVLFPLVMFVRLFAGKLQKKFIIWEWRILYFRSICPIALTSILCLTPYWNRQYHLLLGELGLKVNHAKGVLNSWIYIYKNPITVTETYKYCALIWAAGVVVILVSAGIYQKRLGKALAQSKELGENIWESDGIFVPVMKGIFHKKIFVPKGFCAKELYWLLQHMEYHKWDWLKRLLVVTITAIHWFNPVMWLYYVMWSSDAERAMDEKTIGDMEENKGKEYAQGLLNFSKFSNQERVGFSILSVYERNPEKRAYVMMEYTKPSIRAKWMQWIILSVTILFCFVLSPVYTAWRGQIQGKEKQEQGTLFIKKNKVIGETVTATPQGLQCKVRLEMVSGTEDKNGYDGTFVLKLYDSTDNELASLEMKDIFPKLGFKTYYFSKDLILYAGDYNNDQIQEITLGQKTALTQKELQRAVVATKSAVKIEDYNTYSYSLINVEDKAMTVTMNDMDVITAKEKEQKESIEPGTIEGISDIFTLPVAGKKAYYVWNGDNNTYEKKNLTSKDIKKYKKSKGKSASNQEGQVQEHTLESSDKKTQVLVTTKKDSTSSEDIQSVILSPRRATKKYQDIHGYYCDLKWITESDKSEERYAMLIYNGTKTQTFILYDTKTRTEYYRHEDGTKQLEKLFASYNEKDITFKNHGAVIYSLAEKKEDTLTIEFVAEADNATIKGSYEYNVKTNKATNLNFSQSIKEQTASPSSNPQ